MKKQLEAELISIAHRILKLKNKSELSQLHQEARNLYEKLSVLRFAEEHFADLKPTIGLADIEEKLQEETIFEPKPVVTEVAPVAFEPEEEPTPEPALEESEAATIELSVEQAQTTTENETEETPEVEAEVTTEEEIHDETEEEAEETEPETSEEKIVFHLESDDLDEEVQDESFEEQSEDHDAQIEETIGDSIEEPETSDEETAFKPAFELTFDIKDEEPAETKPETKSASQQITLDDLLGPNYSDPVFVKPEDLAKETPATEPSSVIPISRSYNTDAPVISINKEGQSLNDRLSKGIIIGLNDRIAFMNHLFANSSEDYNRVLSQLMTFNTFAEAKDFIDHMVKPDYNNWEGKDEYAERFMEIVEKRFS